MQTDMTKLIGTFCNYVNMPKYDGVLLSEVNNGFNVALAEFWIHLMYYVCMYVCMEGESKCINTLSLL
jgi:hypothetical protein